MRIAFMCLAMIFLSSVVYADVTSEVIAKGIDSNGNIRVWTQYKIDGKEVESRYPKIDGKYVWATRYSVGNFYGMTDQEQLERIDEDMKAHGETLISNPFRTEIRKLTTDANKEVSLENLIGRKVIVKGAELLVDTDFNGQPDKKWTVKTDGTKIVEDYTVSVTP